MDNSSLSVSPDDFGVGDPGPGFKLVEVKVFSATKRKDRDRLDEVATEWLRAQKFQHVTAAVTLSSDLEYHCMSITFMAWERI